MLLCAGLIGVLAAVTLGGCGDSEGSDSGTSPRGHTRVELGSAKLDDGRVITLVAAEPEGATTGPCLSIVGVDGRRRACGRVPSEREPSQAHRIIVAEALAQTSASAPLEVYGATAADVQSVVVSFRRHGERGRVRGALVMASDPDRLARAGIDGPFGYFLAELPKGAVGIEAVGLDARGAELGSVAYARLRDLHPEAFIAEQG